MSYLYVNNQGSTVAVDGGYFTVTQPDGLVRKIPSATLEYIAAFGNINFTTKAIQECIKNGVVVNFFSKNGTFFGKIESANNVKIGRQRQQFKLSGKTEFALELSKRIISAKIHNQLVVLGRYADNEKFADNFKQIKLAEKAVINCGDVNELLGHEGNAAKNYFYVLGNTVEDEFKFSRRTRQPPKDAFNSMLSLGYTLIMHETYGAILGKGLSPYAGFLHQDHEKHPTLASDLMEEWRAVLIDSLVLSLVQGHEISIKDFYTDDETGAVLLDKTAFSIFIKKYERKMNTETKYLGYVDYKTSFRRAIYLQVNSLAQAIESEDTSLYCPIRLR